MRTIWKYEISVEYATELMVPQGAKVVHVDSQFPDTFDTVALWFEVETDAEFEVPRRMYIYGTGHPIPEQENFVHVGTTITAEGRLVWHVYEQVLR